PQLRVIEPERLQRKIERVARHLPEICVPGLQRTQPRVLQLLVAPQGRQRREVVAERFAATGGRRGVVKKSAIRVEDASADARECGRHNSSYPAQQESFATSFAKLWAASFSPSTVVR